MKVPASVFAAFLIKQMCDTRTCDVAYARMTCLLGPSLTLPYPIYDNLGSYVGLGIATLGRAGDLPRSILFSAVYITERHVMGATVIKNTVLRGRT